MNYEDDSATLHAPSQHQLLLLPTPTQLWICASYQQSANIEHLKYTDFFAKSESPAQTPCYVRCRVVAVMVAWLLPGDIWAQAAVSPEHAPSEHRAQHSAHTGVTRTRSYPQCSAAPANIDSANSDPQQGPHKYFLKGKYFFVFTFILCSLNIFLSLPNIFLYSPTICCVY